MKLKNKLIPLGVIGSLTAAVTPFVCSCEGARDTRPWESVMDLDISEWEVLDDIHTIVPLSNEGATHIYFQYINENPDIALRDTKAWMNILYELVEYGLSMLPQEVPEDILYLEVASCDCFCRDFSANIKQKTLSYDIGRRLSLDGSFDFSSLFEEKSFQLKGSGYLDLEINTKAINVPTHVVYYAGTEIVPYIWYDNLWIVEPDFINTLWSSAVFEMNVSLTGQIKDDKGGVLDVNLGTGTIKLDENFWELASLYEALLGVVGSMLLFGWGSYFLINVSTNESPVITEAI